MRRTVLPLAVALAALAPAAARAGVFTQSVPTAAGGSGAHWQTGPLRAPRRFELLGADWRGSGGQIELRVRRRDGRWSRWVATDAPEPIWSGPATVYELRSTRPPRDARVRFVAVRRPAVAPQAIPAAGLRPAIVPRSAWDPRNECRPRVTPAYGRVDFALVHHTVSINGYSRGAAPAIVLGICLFHRDGNGWNDIGYDLLVDRYGTVFDGRAGDVEQPVVGAQAQGWNDVSTGIAAIGDFSSNPLPGPALHSLARAIAWKLSLAGVPASGSTPPEVSIGGGLNRWPEGAHVRFARISGHRDAGATDCPGNALYAQLPELRGLVARLMPAPRDLLTISPMPLPQAPGAAGPLTGRLARTDGTRPAHVALTLQQRVDGVWQDVGTATTGADGIWSAVAPLVRNGAVRAVDARDGVASPAVAVSVQALVRAHASARHARLGEAIALTGTTSPAKARVRILVARRRSDGRFARAHVLAVRTAEGAFDVAVRPPADGIYRITVATRADALNAAGSSRARLVRVLARR
jgi:hypothetical protein